MVNAAEILALMNPMCDDELPLEDALPWFNEALDDLSKVARILQVAESYYLGGDSIGLPSDLVELVEVRFDGEVIPPATAKPYRRKSYRQIGNVLRFSEPFEEGTFEIDYYRRMKHLEDEESVPELPAEYHNLLALFGASRYWRSQVDEDNRDMMMYNEYLSGRMELDLFTQERDGPYSMQDALPRRRR